MSNKYPNMKINLAKSAGFCFGVERAIKIALDTVKSDRNVVMLGDIVHNEDVIKKIEKAGIKRIYKLTKTENETLLIRAHGTSGEIFNKARDLGYRIVDATCPMVKEIHRIAKQMQRNGYKIIIVGDKNHDEVHGIIGQINTKAIVIDSLKSIPFKALKRIRKACVVVQSTQNLDMTIEIVNVLKRRIDVLKFFNTICRPTRIKQQEIKTMPLENDAMIVIGSKNSANTRRLYEISKSLNHRTYWIKSKYDLKTGWFEHAKSVGITAGASTPDATTKEVIEYIKQIA